MSVVRNLGVLDTPAEEVFDAMTRLAASLLGVPAAFVSIVDTDRDFYKSQVGLPQALADARQQEGETFCRIAIQSTAPLVIADTHAVPAWKLVPTVDSLGVRAYLGVPLVVDDEPIGAFCVIDTQPHEWSPADIETVSQLAQSAAREVKLRAVLRATEQSRLSVQALAKKHEELVAVVAHDLRTPLQVIGATASLLARADDATTQAHAKRIAGATKSMSRLLSELSAVHAYEGAAPQYRAEVSVASLLRDAVDTMSLIATRSGSTLRVADGPDADVAVDYAQMLRVVCNLIGNALKHCGSGSTVELRRWVDDVVTIDVSDDGPGMIEDEQARAFDRGWQGPDALARGDGDGLGLCIVRSLVEQNGGTVSLASVVGAGTTVSIRLPIR